MANLVFELHGQLLRRMADAMGAHPQGLRQAARVMRQQGQLPIALEKKAAAVDCCFTLLRHVTAASCRQMLAEVDAALMQSTVFSGGSKGDAASGRSASLLRESISSGRLSEQADYNTEPELIQKKCDVQYVGGSKGDAASGRSASLFCESISSGRLSEQADNKTEPELIQKCDVQYVGGSSARNNECVQKEVIQEEGCVQNAKGVKKQAQGKAVAPTQQWVESPQEVALAQKEPSHEKVAAQHKVASSNIFSSKFGKAVALTPQRVKSPQEKVVVHNLLHSPVEFQGDRTNREKNPRTLQEHPDVHRSEVLVPTTRNCQEPTIRCPRVETEFATKVEAGDAAGVSHLMRRGLENIFAGLTSFEEFRAFRLRLRDVDFGEVPGEDFSGWLRRFRHQLDQKCQRPWG